MTETMTVQRNGQDVEIEEANDIREKDDMPISGLGKMTCVVNPGLELHLARRSNDGTIREIIYEANEVCISEGKIISNKRPVIDAIYTPSNLAPNRSSYEYLRGKLQ